jgi:hypothetical protein
LPGPARPALIGVSSMALTRLADRGQLGLVDRLEQRGGLRGQLREPGAADRDAGIQEALMLAVQRQVPGELVEQQPDEEAHVGAAPSITPAGAAGQWIVCVSRRLITGRTYLRIT